jgi:glycosyltransferase involved in cell wall biosynthesis
MASMWSPLVSVVVSTHNRPRRLARLLAALRDQTVDCDRFEVVVVDNGSGPETALILEREKARGDLPLRTLRVATTLGPAGGRNLGWQQAAAPLIAFTDDDCQPSSQWLEALLAAAAADTTAVLQGPTRPAPDELDRDGLLSHTVRIEHLGPQYETCNIAYPRPVLEALGGFDERFGLQPAGEDTDLAWRAIAAGHETVFVPAAVVHHAVESVGVAGMLRRAARWSAVVRVFADHPATRPMLYRGRFWNVWHYLLYRSLIALAGPPWLRRLLITGHLLAVRRRARSHSVRRGAGPAAVAFLLVHDAVECCAVARGAIRYRTLVL